MYRLNRYWVNEMNLDYLKYFIKIIDLKSISKAAVEEHLTQSALTQIVKKMENELNCPLITRSNKGIEVTECGQLVYEYAKNMADTHNSMLSRLQCMTKGCYSIVIKPCCSMDNNLLPAVLFKIQNQFKNIKLDVILDCKPKIISEIKIGITDFGVVMGELKDIDDLDVDTIGIEKIVLVAGNQLIKSDKICLCELENYKLIDFSLGSYGKEVYKIIQKHEKKDHSFASFSPFFSIDSIGAIKTLLESNFGVSFLPYYAVRDEITQGKLKSIEIEGFNLNLPIHILSKKDSQLQPLLVEIKKSFIDHAKRIFNK